MKLVIILIAVVIVIASILADYKWRRWMATRRHDQNDSNPTLRT